MHHLDFQSSHIVVIGDIMLDEYIDTNVSRISPEAPVPVAHLKKRWSVPGGAANVARNLSNLGCKVTLFGVIGKDNRGEELSSLLYNNLISTSFFIHETRPTTHKARVVCKGQQLLRIDNELSCAYETDFLMNSSKYICNSLMSCNAIIFSDYGKGFLLRNLDNYCLMTDVINAAKMLNIPIIIDPKGTDWERYSGADCVTPNISEFYSVINRYNLSSKNFEIECNNLINYFSLKRLIVTKSEKGMFLFEPERYNEHIDAISQDIVDVSGAGDTVIATLSACISINIPWNRAFKIANAAAGIVIKKSGTTPIDINELNNSLRSYN